MYPKYFIIDPKLVILSGFKAHIFQEKIGLGMPGPTLHGTNGMKIDVIKAAAEITPE